MQGREWLYYLLDNMGRSYYMNNGLVSLSAQPKPLRYTPDGWQDISIGWERNTDVWGATRNFTIPQRFVLDAADILRYLWSNKNIEEIVRLLIQKQTLIIDSNYYYFFHKFFYRGELDLSTYKDTETGVSMNIMEGGVSKSLNANKNAVYEIAPTDVLVKMDGMILISNKRFAVLEATYAHGNSGSGVKEMLPMQVINSEATGFNVYYKDSVASPVDAGFSHITGDDLTTSEKYNGSAKRDTTVKSVKLTGSIVQDLGFINFRVGFDYKLATNTGRVIDLFTLNHDFTGTNVPYKFTLTSPTFQLFENETFFIYQTPNAFQNSNRWGYGDDTVFDYTTLDRVPTTFVKAQLPDNLHSKLCEKMTGVTGVATSSLLIANRNLVVTSGDAMRGLAGAVIKTNYNDFYQSFNTVLNAGYGIIQDKIVFESKAFFLNDSNVIPLGQVKNLQVNEGVDFLGNLIKIGYPAKDSDDVNGKYSFNNTSQYTSPITRVTKEIPILSKYIVDPFVLEIYRANLEGKKTTDDSKDNTVIILNIDYSNPQFLEEETNGLPAGTTYYNLKRTTYDVVQGVDPDVVSSLYNVEDLTPARLMEKHRSYLNSIFYGFQGQQLTFQTTDKSRNFYTSKAGVVYDEDGNFTITNTGLFKHVIFEFEPATSPNLVELLETNPNRCFSFIHPNGNTYRGFNLKIGIAPNSLEDQVFQLLAVYDQDLTTLKTWVN